ncbi:benzoate/H(+) symporter BenE family transporter [Marinobacterium arenosum]|uniref:benzoate/H(+) symporter BenE family transporter n=1 Tax=Marinobacterium arenosum TaxID=2862496 RepID=UPI001C9408ED|nr:benzoate/H(+) symporter BenE family transporter [Marinobacterium arenosum]MBY4676185.1 benzoate/H(+) symporter BenE family transporter [Marinobacterium arenosum]
MLSQLRLNHVSAGFIAVLVGFTSSVALVFQAAEAAGADPALINSWLLSLGIAMGVTSIGLSWYYRMPVLTAWSTPGAALLASSLSGSTPGEAVGAFIAAALLTVVCGLLGWIERLARLIPGNITSAMLAGVLINLGIGVFAELEQQPLLIGLMLLTYLIGKRLSGRYAIPLVLVVALLVSWQLGLLGWQTVALSIARPVFVMPEFSLAAMIGVALPLFLVTLSSQNILGLSTLRANGYQPPVSPIITSTGLINLLLAPFGCFSMGLAAITAAICMTEDADADPKKRYLASICAGFFYLLTALFGATVVALFAASPAGMVMALAGIALFATIGNSLANALREESGREAALLTFMVTASGLSLFDISAAFWGLLVGLLVHYLQHSNRAAPAAQPAAQR